MAKTTTKKTKKTSKSPQIDVRDALLLAVLPRAGDLGWGREALAEAALDVGIPLAKAEALFPEPLDLVLQFSNWTDREMQKALAMFERPTRIRDRVALGVQQRLEVIAPYKPAVRQAMKLLAKPWHVTEALRDLYGSVDAIWVYAGDTATDYNFYTKRALLAGVYTSTFLRFMGDESDGHAATWDFLDARIDNVMTFGKITGKLKERFASCGQ